MRDRDTRKQIAFDLDTTESGLKTYYNEDRVSAYRELQNALQNSGFERVQYSVYHSKESMTYLRTIRILHDIDIQLAWLTLCLNSRTITEIGAFTQDFSIDDKLNAQRKYFGQQNH